MKKPTYRTADTIVSATKLALQAADALIPYLERVAALGVVIIEIAEKAKYNKTAIRNLALEVTRIFHEIQRLYKSKARNESFEDSYEQIYILLDEIISYLKTLEGRGRLFRIVHGDQDATRIDEFRQRLKFQLDLLGVRSYVAINDVQNTVTEIEQTLKRLVEDVNPLLLEKQSGALSSRKGSTKKVRERDTRSPRTYFDFSGATMSDVKFNTITGDYNVYNQVNVLQY